MSKSILVSFHDLMSLCFRKAVSCYGNLSADFFANLTGPPKRSAIVFQRVNLRLGLMLAIQTVPETIERGIRASGVEQKERRQAGRQ